MKPLFPGLPVKMLALFLLVLVIPLKAAISKEKSHIRTLVIVSHPYPERSVMIKGLQQAAESVDGVTVRNLETLYGFDTRKINGDEERRITRQNDRIVFIFPTHWFNITPMMKAYICESFVGEGICTPDAKRPCSLSGVLNLYKEMSVLNKKFRIALANYCKSECRQHKQCPKSPVRSNAQNMI
ncbi:TPA: NAD(P)H-dependent oxidoreductase [Klebsiella variicola subsp. variicola]